MSTKVLFILKRREDYNPVEHSPLGLSTGLFNSASFVVKMLQESNIKTEIEVAIDNNCIDRLVNKHKPTHVIIEALWVVPSKFAVLTKLHPSVKWIIRLHSEMPFMAGEGMAMNWVGDYVGFSNLYIGVNTPRMLDETRTFLQIKKNWSKKETENRVIYMPNYFPQTYNTKAFNADKDIIDIACFGAVRPLKNHLLQAFAALKFATKIKKKLHFHINSGRIEMNGQPALHNLQGLFIHLHDAGHRLIHHDWAPREQFLKTCAQMDIGLQCSFSETFNIVNADLVSQGIPVVGSSEIPWSSYWFSADPTSSEDIKNKLLLAYNLPQTNVSIHQSKLTKYTNKTRSIWASIFKTL